MPMMIIVGGIFKPVVMVVVDMPMFIGGDMAARPVVGH